MKSFFIPPISFANPELTGDGSGGRMTMEKLGEIFELISSCGDVAGLTSLFKISSDGPSSVGFTKSMFCGLSRALQKSFLYFTEEIKSDRRYR